MNDQNDDKTHTHVVLTNGTMVSHYRIIEKIGAGGMGEVYLAEDIKLGRKVALKFLPSHLVSNVEINTRFVREAQTLAKLNHPNIVSIYEVSVFQGRPFYVMEYVAGQTLAKCAQGKPISVERIIDFITQICQGLSEAHRAGIVHRDIKPANISVDKQGRIRLLDFGLATAEDDDRLTKTGSTPGTVSYMSPEQILGRPVDHRSDLFSLGIVLYELITGRTPFKGDSEGATLKAILENRPEPLARYKADVPETIQQIVSELLEKDRELRCQSAENIIAALKRLIYDSQPNGPIRSIEKKPRRAGLVIGVVVVIALSIAGVMYFGMQPEESATDALESMPMIAVLPFENLGSPDDQYFADGMTDEITSRLAGIKGLGVISRTSSVKIRASNKSLQEIGRDHGVDFVLEGTVRWSKAGDQPMVRIAPQLIRVSDDRLLWSTNFERELMEVFAVQADIAEKIVDQLGLTLVESDKQNLSSIPTDNPRAYQFYLKAVQVYEYSSDYQGTIDAKPLVDSAVALDSTFALALALRSDIYANSAGKRPDSEEGRIALESARRALALQPGLPQAYLALGRYYAWVEDDNDRALEHYLLAKSGLNNDAPVLKRISDIQFYRGQFQEALTNLTRAAELDPLNAKRHTSLGSIQMSLRMFKEAEQSFSRAIALEPDVQYYYEDKIECLIAQFGDIEKVRPVVSEALRHCDTMEFVIKNSTVTRYLPELNTDSIITAFIQEQRATTTEKHLFHDRSFFWFSHLNILEGRDSEARIQLERLSTESDWTIGWRGLILSFLGECEKATEFGLRRKQMMSDGEHQNELASTAMLMARIYANCGRYDEAIDEIDYALSLSTYVTVISLNLKHWIDPFRHDLRFQTLLEKYE